GGEGGGGGTIAGAGAGAAGTVAQRDEWQARRAEASMAATETPPTETGLTPAALETALARLASGGSLEEGDRLAARVRDWFGAGDLGAGPDPRVEELTAAWAIEAPGAGTRVRVLADDGSFVLPLMRLGGSEVFAGAATLQSG